jgi:hypothetical protein
MGAQHTPGPWTIGDCGQIIGADGKSVAFAAASRMTIEDVDADNGPASANARLIAAAPELLEAALSLKAAEDAHANCKCWEDCGPCTKCGARFEDVRDLRGAAITKATGAA